MDSPASLLAIKPQHYQGQQRLKEHWPSVVNGLRLVLRESGFEEAESNDNLLLFSFSHPHAAITTLASYTHATNRELAEHLSGKPLPIQNIVLLRQADDQINCPYRNPDAGVWELLSPEVIHITKALKNAWEPLMAQKPLLPCAFSDEGDGLFTLQLTAGAAIKTEAILPWRALPLKGREVPCFYCGMQNHRPAQCPSKFLAMDHNGLASVGYLPFEQLSQLYHKVFSNPEAMTKLLATGIEPTQIRKDPALMVFIGYLDINRVYQPRFLWGITFSRFSKWQSVFKAELLQPDNKNLQLGLDCLRVGKYNQAEEFLLRECQVKSTRRFSAAIGLAFVALEQRGLAEMRSHLELAKSMASQPKERIYIDLLLSRFYDLVGEVWKARDTVKNIITAQSDCPDAMYRKLQIEAKGNFSTEAGQLLRSLLLDQRTLYMATLMDSALLPIQGKVEDLLLTQYGTMASSAQDFLAQANHEIDDLCLWFDSNDPQIQAHQATLDSLLKRLARKSYFDVIDVEHKAKILLATSRQLREGKLNELYDQINRVKGVWGGYYRFWVDYGYKIFFKEFADRLLPVEKALNEAGELAKKNEGTTYQQSVQLLRTAEEALASLNLLQGRMIWVGLLCDSSTSFCKKLVLTEIGGFLLASALVFGLGQLPDDGHSLDGLTALVNTPLFQKKATILTAFLVAPLVALSWTIKDQLRG